MKTRKIVDWKDIANSYDSPIYAIADDIEGNSIKVLETMGFELVNGRFFKWVG